MDLLKGVYLLVALALGVVYYALDLRRVIFENELRRVDSNIKRELTKPFIGVLMTEGEARKLIADESFKDRYFYSIIDQDKSLEKKSQSIMFNGALWTSAADLSVISFVYGVFYTGFALNNPDAWSTWLPTALVLVAIASFFLMKQLTKKHLERSSRQLGLITSNHKQQLQDKFEQELSELRGDNP